MVDHKSACGCDKNKLLFGGNCTSFGWLKGAVQGGKPPLKDLARTLGGNGQNVFCNFLQACIFLAMVKVFSAGFRAQSVRNVYCSFILCSDVQH